MEERVSLLDGSFKLVTEEGGGTRAEVRLPLTREKVR